MIYQLIDPINLVTLGLLAPISLVLGNWILKPLTMKPVERKSWQCSLLDVFLLLLQLGVTALLTFEVDPEFGAGSEIAGLWILWAFLFLSWWMGVRGLSRRGIKNPVCRAIVLGVICPLTFTWPLACLIVNPIFFILFGGFILALPLLVGVFLLRKFATWIVRDSPEASAISSLQRTSDWVVAIRWSLSTVLMLGTMKIITAPIWSGITIGPVYYKTALRRFRNTMQCVDIGSIQKWLLTKDLTKLGKESWGALKAEELPAGVLSLSHRVFPSGSNSLKLVWGGGFGHWGVEIGLPGTPMPPSHSREYHLPLADGAWVWHEIQ